MAEPVRSPDELPPGLDEPEEPEVVDTVTVKQDDDGPKGTFLGKVRLLLMSDDTVRWSCGD